MFERSGRGFLVVFSAPSGAGKSTIVREVLRRKPVPGMELSISATTRPRRPGEEEGRDYYFLSEEEFESRRERGEFVEWAEVHGHLYGTLRRTVEEALEEGKVLLLEIDVQGARQIRRAFPESVSVFVAPPSLEVLEKRLRERGRDPEEDIERRLEAAPKELSEAGYYDYIVVNEDLEEAVRAVEAILVAEYHRTCRFKVGGKMG
ncbi:MAG: guanylate kinase [Candidatus Latescibacterota bacterium]|nr:MAG: guanylate kinase [Candidatus Latescibacterota bacterium]RKY74640.1 MAG: guanylate kinase [Candidatus Latescibacterota bacterium]